MSIEQVWRTENLPVAAFIHANRSLKFLRCEPTNRSGILEFVFADPEGTGDQLEMSYDSGGKVIASAHFSAIRFLRSKMNTNTITNTGASHGRAHQSR